MADGHRRLRSASNCHGEGLGDTRARIVAKPASDHGSGSSRRIGGKVNKVTDLGAFIDADIILCGHMHDKIVIRNSMLRLDTQGKLASKDRLFAITGTFLKTYGHDGYGARNLYAPTSIGVPTICIKPHTRELWAIT